MILSYANRLRELTQVIDSPILCFRCLPLTVLSRFLFPDREAAKSKRPEVWISK